MFNVRRLLINYYLIDLLHTLVDGGQVYLHEITRKRGRTGNLIKGIYKKRESK